MSIQRLLQTIRSVEAPQGYSQMFSAAEQRLGQHDLTGMTLNEVQGLQDKMKRFGSSAAGGYQFLQGTLDDLMERMNLTGEERFTPELQDQMAVELLKRRGLNQYLEGSLSPEKFANNLAKEWAALPVVTPINGKQPGQSYYAGDGLNKSLIDTNTVLSSVQSLKGTDPGEIDIASQQSSAAHRMAEAFSNAFGGQAQAAEGQSPFLQQMPDRGGSQNIPMQTMPDFGGTGSMDMQPMPNPAPQEDDPDIGLLRERFEKTRQQPQFQSGRWSEDNRKRLMDIWRRLQEQQKQPERGEGQQQSVAPVPQGMGNVLNLQRNLGR